MAAKADLDIIHFDSGGAASLRVARRSEASRNLIARNRLMTGAEHTRAAHEGHNRDIPIEALEADDLAGPGDWMSGSESTIFRRIAGIRVRAADEYKRGAQYRHAGQCSEFHHV